jgi:hypothetical protein
MRIGIGAMTVDSDTQSVNKTSPESQENRRARQLRPPVYLYGFLRLQGFTNALKNVLNILRLIPRGSSCIGYTVGVQLALVRTDVSETYVPETGVLQYHDSRFTSEKVAGLQRRSSKLVYDNLVTLPCTSKVHSLNSKFTARPLAYWLKVCRLRPRVSRTFRVTRGRFCFT